MMALGGTAQGPTQSPGKVKVYDLCFPAAPMEGEKPAGHTLLLIREQHSIGDLMASMEKAE
jgi:hypothetical protein